MTPLLRRACAVLLVSLVAAVAHGGDYELGVELLDQGKWVEALPLYQRLTRELPDDAWCWQGLGWSRHYTGDYAGALPAYRRALQLGALRSNRIWLEIARCQVALGHRDSAYAALDEALRTGLTQVANLRSDGRLAALRNEPRFHTITGWLDSARVDRTGGWRHDLRLLSREVKRMRVTPFAKISEAEFDREIARLSSAVPKASNDALAVGVMRLMTRLGDGHTSASAPFQLRSQRGLPIQVLAFDDGWFVTAVTAGDESLLWARVDSVDGRAIASVARGLESVCSRDNSEYVLSAAPRLIRYPQILKELGLARQPDGMVLSVTDRKGQVRRVRLETRQGPHTWIREPEGAKLASWMRERFEYHWLEVRPEQRLLFVAYNGCADEDSQTVEQFAARVREAADRPDVDRMVIDLRWNGGGNNFLNQPLLEAIIQARRLNRPSRLFAIAGRHTFSAAMCLAAELDRYTHARFVGEPTGSSPNFIGETNFVTLPYSGVLVSISNLYWQNTRPVDERIWIAPRIPVPFRFADAIAGRDAAVEAILRQPLEN
jgi:hypothetical protein